MISFNNSTVACWLVTESMDNYLFLQNVMTVKEMVDHIAHALGDELAYVFDWEVHIIGELSKSDFSNLLGATRSKLRDELDKEYGDDHEYGVDE